MLECDKCRNRFTCWTNSSKYFVIRHKKRGGEVPHVCFNGGLSGMKEENYSFTQEETREVCEYLNDAFPLYLYTIEKSNSICFLLKKGYMRCKRRK